MTSETATSKGLAGQASAFGDGDSPLFSEELFTKLLCLERKRSERSRKPFVLMLVNPGKLLQTDRPERVLERIIAALMLSTRETDVRGWYREGSVIGVIFTEFGSAGTKAVRDTISRKVTSALRSNLEPGQMEKIHISFHVFPEDGDLPHGGGVEDFGVYPDLFQEERARKGARLVKRASDIAGSLIFLILCSPLLLAIAIAVKLTSKGPVLFKQERIGLHGACFTFLKFRSMYFLSDPRIHQDYVRRLISGKEEGKQPDGHGGVYKLTDDPRITPLGRFLRKTSLDELPQLVNVLCGEMSLVGPRPPIPYEVQAYDLWHCRRFLEVKPGITGLWKIRGRSKMKFEEMVRLDLQYARTWSLGLDLKILLQTPRAVLSRSGAY